VSISKSKIDKAGLALARNRYRSDDEYFKLEEVFDEYRKSHLQPLTETTLTLQSWLSGYPNSYYIAQRLKRKPQIIRKLLRFNTRLTQLQDIGGARIIVETNSEADRLYGFLLEQIRNNYQINLLKETDYREKGRDDSGYRALHLILDVGGRKVELQIRGLPLIEWVDYRMSDERQRAIYTDSGYPFSLASV